MQFNSDFTSSVVYSGVTTSAAPGSKKLNGAPVLPSFPFPPLPPNPVSSRSFPSHSPPPLEVGPLKCS